MRPLTLSVLLESSQKAAIKQNRRAKAKAEIARREDSEERVVGSMGIRGLTKKPSQPNEPNFDQEMRDTNIRSLRGIRRKLKTKQVQLGNDRTRPLEPAEEKEERRRVGNLRRRLRRGGVAIKR